MLMKSRKINYYLDLILQNWRNPKKIKNEQEINQKRLLVEYESIYHYK